MKITTPIGDYRWIENWITVPETENGRTHGVAVSREGNVIVFHQANPGVLFYSPDGKLLNAWGDFPGAHGLTLVEEEGVEYLWLTDEKNLVVVKTTLQGEIVQSLPAPTHPAYSEKKYIPTWAAPAPNGEIWVADGYGANLVHRYSAEGHHIGTLDGSEGAGLFRCPHGLALDTRREEAEFYIADRGNKRFQVYGIDGKFRRSFGEEFLTSPDVCFPMGEHLIVPELISRISILDGDDQPVALFGANDEVNTLPGWPNNRENVVEGKFNSPHSATADAAGNIYVVEWITGGRVTKLEKIF